MPIIYVYGDESYQYATPAPAPTDSTAQAEVQGQGPVRIGQIDPMDPEETVFPDDTLYPGMQQTYPS